MKALFFVIGLAIAGFNQIGLAQSTFHVGLTGGLTGDLIHFSWMPSNQKSTALWRYNAGLSFEHRLTPALTLSYDLLFSRQGGGELITSPLGYGSDQIIFKIDYLTLPMMLRYHPAGGRVWIGGGPQLGYLLGAKDYTLRFGEASAQRWDLQYDYRLDKGLTAGVGYRFGQHIQVATRYYYGLRPIQGPDPSTGTYSDAAQKLYNRIWSTNLTYYFK